MRNHCPPYPPENVNDFNDLAKRYLICPYFYPYFDVFIGTLEVRCGRASERPCTAPSKRAASLFDVVS